MFTLRYTENGTPRVHGLAAGTTSIGRALGCTLVIGAPSVSRQHASLRVTVDRCYLRDMGSRHGTSLNGRVIKDEVELKSGDKFALGEVTISLDQSFEERVAVGDDRQLIERGNTLVKNVDPAATPDPASNAAADAARLLRLLSEIGRTLVTVQPLPQVLSHVVNLVFDNLPAERAFLLLRDSATEGLTPRVARCRDGSVPNQAALSRTVVNLIMRERVAMLASDARYDPRLDSANSVMDLNIRSFVCAPLWNRNDVIGVLYADNPISRKFSPADLEIFTALSNYAAVAIEQARLSDQLLKETRRRERLQRYHSPGVVNRILRDIDSSDGAFVAQERDLTVMFCDIVGFTTITEGHPPQQVVATLNNFFEQMTDIVFEFDGTLDKFIGDAILAVFGAPFDQPDHSLRAVQTALEMRRALARLNERQPGVQLEVRIGIATGVAMTGDVGSPRRKEFTVLGDVVNTASRLESDVAEPGQIVMTRGTYDRIREAVAVRPLGKRSVRGRQGDVELFEVLDLVSTSAPQAAAVSRSALS